MKARLLKNNLIHELDTSSKYVFYNFSSIIMLIYKIR